jgi:uncharacterized protein
MSNHLTPSEFHKYLKCPNWVYWDVFGDPNDKGDVPEMMKKLREDGLLHEKDVIKEYEPYVQIPDAGTIEEQFAATLKAMKAGKTVYQGTLMNGDWAGRPDLLVPRAEPSKLGDWSYEAIEIKSAHEANDTHKYQMVFYALLLERVQGERPIYGKIINAEKKTLVFPLEDVYGDFYEILNRILAIRAGQKPDPFFMSACKDSPWYETCKKEAESLDDVSLVYKLYKSEYKKLKEAGYHTLTSVALASLSDLAEQVRGISEVRLERIRTQASALKNHRVIRIAECDLPVDPTELFFDIEGDPLIGVEYLFGLLVREDGFVRYEKFLAETPEDEGKAWLAFCDFMEKYAGTAIYHYGWYEMDVIRRLSSRYGISKKAAEALDARNMIDLVRAVQRLAVFPLYFYSLKDVAKHLGFKWRASDASGANSVMWFQDWLNKKDRAMLQKIIDYNEDDVRATLFLKDWLASGK